MYKNVLVCTDGSILAAGAIAPAMALAKAFSGRVTGISVSVPYHVLSSDPLSLTDTEDRYMADSKRLSGQYLAAIGDAAKAAGLPYKGVHVYADHVHEAIIETAAREGCDVIVMASHGRRGARALLLGSETVKVLTHSKIPVLVVR